MRPVICVLDMSPGPNRIRAYVSDRSWLDSNRQRHLLDIHGASETKLLVSGTITVHLCLSESRTRISFSDVNKLVVTFFLGMTNIDRIIESIHAAETKVLPYQFPQVPILMEHETKEETQRNSTDTPKEMKNNWHRW